MIGVLLTTRRPEHPVSWVIAGAALVSAVFVLAHAYAVQALVTDPGSLPAGLVAAWLDGWGWLPGLVVLPCALLLLMPDGHLRSRRWWPAAASLVLGTVLAAAAVSSQATFDLGGPAPIENPLGHQGVAAAAAGLVGALLLLAAVIASLASFGVRFRSSVGEERQQLRWVGLSLASPSCSASSGSSSGASSPAQGCCLRLHPSCCLPGSPSRFSAIGCSSSTWS